MTEDIKKLLAEQLRVDIARLNDDTDLVDDLGVDSLDVADILMSIEEKFGVVVPDEDVSGLRTVKNIADYVQCRS